MLFNSFTFIIFFPLVTIIYFTLRHNYRWPWLLFSSIFFYMFFIPTYILILVVTIIVDYAAAILIEKEENEKKKRVYLIISVITTLFILFIFKYYNFFTETFISISTGLGYNIKPNFLNIILPIGLSFHTFQSMSYVIEVYRGNQKSEKHFGIYSLYVLFYPQLVAGPIERPQNLLGQFYKNQSFEYEKTVEGLRLILWGMFKKVVIADRVAIYVNKIFENPTEHSGITLLVATYFFAIQIYCDFSGYSDIARGAAKVMGFELMINFKRPYFAKSISEFWTRWHISLSTWFKDYVYIPLGGNRVNRLTWYRNLLFVFLISGLWHGANWTFVVWGVLHGLFLVIGDLSQKPRLWFKMLINKITNKKINNAFSMFIVFHLACLGWIYFRANSLNDANHIVTSIITIKTGPLFIGAQSHMFYSCCAILLLLYSDFLIEKNGTDHPFTFSQAHLRWSAYTLCLLYILTTGVFDGGEFIYFQF